MMEEVIEEKSFPEKNEIWEWIKAIIIAGILVFIIRAFIFLPFVVDGPSMQPNFYTGERLIVNKLIYTIRKPHRGEVIVFLAPEGKDYIKRVIGLAGDKIKVINNIVYVNGKQVDEDYIQAVEAADPKYNRDFPDGNIARTSDGSYVVPQGTVFAMGDNRPDSNDSRVPAVGPVPYNKIVGRADFIFWPLNQMKFVHF